MSISFQRSAVIYNASSYVEDGGYYIRCTFQVASAVHYDLCLSSGSVLRDHRVRDGSQIRRGALISLLISSINIKHRVNDLP